MTAEEMRVALRQTSAADRSYCYHLHRSALGPYVEQIWGWDEEVQRARHDERFDPKATQIITVDGRDAGSLNVESRADEVYLARIEIHPDYQGRGIGGHVVRALLREAADRGQDVVLDVLTVNTGARAFYERLGFREVGRPAEHKIRLRSGKPGVRTASATRSGRPGHDRIR